MFFFIYRISFNIILWLDLIHNYIIKYKRVSLKTAVSHVSSSSSTKAETDTTRARSTEKQTNKYSTVNKQGMNSKQPDKQVLNSKQKTSNQQ